jgi:energy-coupling factor transporter ATP-binding protein EcfA2
MKLQKLSFVEFPGQPPEWKFDDFTLGQINLVVGRNSVGKSRLLSVISNFGKMLTGEIKEPPYDGRFEALFSEDQNTWTYDVKYDHSEIVHETLIYNGKDVLMRGKGGIGQIDAKNFEDKEVRMRFKTPLRQLGVVSKRDSFQHPYLDGLYEWGHALRHFQFGSEMGPHNLAIALAVKGLNVEIDEKNTSSLVPIYDLAIRQPYGEELKQTVMADMETLGYHITELGIRKPAYNAGMGTLMGDFVGLCAKEQELDVMTDQPNMSQGMFRTLSLLIQTTHYMMSNKSGCILIDDIGEGLDFERSCILIDLLREKAKRSSFQLIMSTNNRFVMNRVPLEEWCVLERTKGHVRVRNYANSAAAFEEFKITGLSNFDLFATNFLAGK